MELVATYRNGKMFNFHGKTKKECHRKFKDKFGNSKGFINLEYRKDNEKKK